MVVFCRFLRFFLPLSKLVWLCPVGLSLFVFVLFEDTSEALLLMLLTVTKANETTNSRPFSLCLSVSACISNRLPSRLQRVWYVLHCYAGYP